MSRAWACALLLLALGDARAEDIAAVVGKQRAAALPLQWEVREAGHPLLGPVRFGVLKTPVVTSAGTGKVYSRAYFSCQTGIGKLAIELTNTTTPDGADGLRPGKMPRLVCNRPEPGKSELVREDLFANWEVNAIGDALTRGFRPFPLRECATITVEQDVQLPRGSATPTAAVTFDIAPYSRELDAVFVACGETSAYSDAPSKKLADAAPKKPADGPPKKIADAPKAQVPAAPPAPVPPPVVAAARPPSIPDAGGWRNARAVTDGKTNVRAQPSVQAPVVTQLFPGAVLLVQPAGPDWWRVRPSSGAAFDGYVRGDRLNIK